MLFLEQARGRPAWSLRAGANFHFRGHRLF